MKKCMSDLFDSLLLSVFILCLYSVEEMDDDGVEVDASGVKLDDDDEEEEEFGKSH